MTRTIKRTDARTGKPVAPLLLNDKLNVGDKFRLIGNTRTFVAQRLIGAAGPLQEVYGVSECGGFGTGARVRDTAQPTK
ncbi:TPA: hypothetical protein QDB28_004063 [Burkholderia vietnamiensis]|nr:hypothetical protein [Burkholderia vietnamiensis]